MPTLRGTRRTNGRLLWTGSDRRGCEQDKLATPSSATLEMAKDFTPVKAAINGRGDSRRPGENNSLALKEFDHEDHSHRHSSPTNASPLPIDDTSA
jgi:hypothetical protein